MDICTLYEAAPQLAAAGERVVSTDEMTGVQSLERAFLLRHLEANGWNITRTAEHLGIERSNLHRKLRAFGLEAPPSRP